MSREPNVVGVLRNWRKHVCRPDGAFVIWGFVYDDFLNRFYDGQFIHTAKIVKIVDNLAYTAKHVYRLDGEPEGPAYNTACEPMPGDAK